MKGRLIHIYVYYCNTNLNGEQQTPFRTRLGCFLHNIATSTRPASVIVLVLKTNIAIPPFHCHYSWPTIVSSLPLPLHTFSLLSCLFSSLGLPSIPLPMTVVMILFLPVHYVPVLVSTILYFCTLLSRCGCNIFKHYRIKFYT